MDSNSNIIINKATLVGGLFLKVSYEELLPGNIRRNHPNMTASNPIHPDMIAAFAALTPHMALICEEITENEFIDALPEEYDATEPSAETFEVEFGEEVKAANARGKKKAKEIKLKEGVKGAYKPGDILNDENLLGEPNPEVKAIDHFVCTYISFTGYVGSENISLAGTKTLSTKKQMSIGTPSIKLEPNEYKYYDMLSQDGEMLKYEIIQFLLHGKQAVVEEPDLFNQNMDELGGDDHEEDNHIE
jgi:hypothetical protein